MMRIDSPGLFSKKVRGGNLAAPHNFLLGIMEWGEKNGSHFCGLNLDADGSGGGNLTLQGSLILKLTSCDFRWILSARA